MKSVDILVSIVNWNSSNGLKECVNSFYNMLSASNYSFVIKIYDNNSTDESLSFQIVDEERIQVIRGKKNEGLKSHQYNLLNTEYKFLIVSNSDILYKAVSYTHLRAHETVLDLVCRLLLEKKKQGRGDRNSGCSGEMLRYQDELQWRTHLP